MNRKKPLFEEIQANIESSIYIAHQFEKDVLRDDYWHFHNSYELVFLPSGSGKRYVSDRVSTYENGDLVLLPPNTPHNTLFKEHVGSLFEQYVILFDFSPFRNFFSVSKEFNHISKFMDTMSSGISFDGDTKQQAGILIQKMKGSTPFNKILLFFELMSLIATSKEYELLGSSEPSDMPKIYKDKIRYVNEYMNRNFTEKVSSSGMAAKIGMTESSFCRFYKKSTGKTFKKALTEIRIQNACYLLKDTTLPIKGVALESGFASTPLFYKFFKNIMKQKPSEYRSGVF